MEIKDLRGIVSGLPFFQGFPEKYMELLIGCARNERFEPGEFLCRENRSADNFFVIRKGLVGIETFVPGQGALRLQTIGSDEVLGWSWLVPPYRWRFDGRALEQTRVIAFEAACLRDKCGEDPQLGYELLKRVTDVLAARLQATRLQILDVYGAPAARPKEQNYAGSTFDQV